MVRNKIGKQAASLFLKPTHLWLLPHEGLEIDWPKRLAFLLCFPLRDYSLQTQGLLP